MEDKSLLNKKVLLSILFVSFLIMSAAYAEEDNLMNGT